jgi:hypothetical protein
MAMTAMAMTAMAMTAMAMTAMAMALDFDHPGCGRSRNSGRRGHGYRRRRHRGTGEQ